MTDLDERRAAEERAKAKRSNPKLYPAERAIVPLTAEQPVIVAALTLELGDRAVKALRLENIRTAADRRRHIIRRADDRWAPYEVDPATGCWVWRSASGTGYGGVRAEGRTRNAHRYMYETLRGLIPDGLVLDHLCRNRRCVNPDHLEPVTNAENILRGVSPAARYAKATHCINGHEFTPDNTYTPPRGGRQCRACARERDRLRGPGWERSKRKRPA